MTDSNVLKPVFGKLEEETSYKVIFRTDEGTFGMYVWAEDSDEAKREVLKRVSGAVIERVEVGRPE